MKKKNKVADMQFAMFDNKFNIFQNHGVINTLVLDSGIKLELYV